MAGSCAQKHGFPADLHLGSARGKRGTVSRQPGNVVHESFYELLRAPCQIDALASGLQSLGLIVTGVNLTYKPAEALMQIEATGPGPWIVMDVVHGLLFAPVAKECGFAHVIVTNLADCLDMPSEQKEQALAAGTISSAPVPDFACSFQELLGSDPLAFENQAGADDAAVYAMTGGNAGIFGQSGGEGAPQSLKAAESISTVIGSSAVRRLARPSVLGSS